MTAFTPPDRRTQQIPVFRFDENEAEQAYFAFAALRKAAMADPALIENPYFTALQDTAYARFYMAFEAME